MKQTIAEIKQVLPELQHLAESTYTTFVSSLPIDIFKMEYIYPTIIVLLSTYILFTKKKKNTIPQGLQKRIASRLQEQNATIEKAKLYIHVFTTTIAQYRNSVDALLEDTSRVRGMLILPTVGGKVPILTTESFYTLLYCSIAFTQKKAPFETNLRKQKEIIQKELGFLPTLDKHSNSDYHAYVARAEYTADAGSIYSLQKAS